MTSAERIRELAAKLLRAENLSVIIAVADQLKIAIEIYVRQKEFIFDPSRYVAA